VLKVGSAVRGISIGDHVLLTYNHCGACGPCQQEKPYQCSDIRQRNFGCKRPDGSDYIHYENQPVSGCFFGQSSFCNPAIVQEASCVKIDPSLPLSRLCTLGCGFQTGAGAVFNLVKPVDHQVQSLAIWGCGGVGLAAIMAANAIKNGHPGVLDRIIAIDINEERLELAKSFGATDAINSRQPDVERRLGEVTEGRGPDAAIDCTGLVPVVNQMIQSLGAGGMAVTVGGPPPGQQASIDVFPFLLNCKTYVGCHQGNSYSRKVSTEAEAALIEWNFWG
jgi:aryl-alcohol dehydrogenase